MRNKRIVIGAFLLAITLIAFVPCQSQIIYGQKSSGDVQLIYSNWKLKTEAGTTKVNQLMFPLTAFVPLGTGFEASFFIANSSNNLDVPGSSYSLNGLSNLRMQVSRALANDALVVSGGVSLPTGKKNLDIIKEWRVVEYLSQNFLEFPMSRFGEGLGFNLLLGGAATAGTIQYGGGVMFQYNGKYTPYQFAGDYKPGNALSVNAGASLKRDLSVFSLDGIFTTYSADKLDNAKIFKQSPQVDMRLGWMLNQASYKINANIRYLSQGKNTRYGKSEQVLEQLKIYGNEFSAGAGMTWFFSRDWSLAPSAVLRLIAANEESLGKSNLFGPGIALGRKLGQSADIGVGLKYYTGKADASRIDLTGYQITTNITARF